MAAFKLLQSKAYNTASKVYEIELDGEIWTVGGVSLAAIMEKGVQEMRLRKETLDYRAVPPMPGMKLKFDPDQYEPVTHFAYHKDEKEETVEVFTENGSAWFNGAYFNYLNTRYGFAKRYLNCKDGVIVFMVSDKPIAFIAKQKERPPET